MENHKLLLTPESQFAVQGEHLSTPKLQGDSPPQPLPLNELPGILEGSAGRGLLKAIISLNFDYLFGLLCPWGSQKRLLGNMKAFKRIFSPGVVVSIFFHNSVWGGAPGPALSTPWALSDQVKNDWL